MNRQELEELVGDDPYLKFHMYMRFLRLALEPDSPTLKQLQWRLSESTIIKLQDALTCAYEDVKRSRS